jgi:hypothetical protein
MESNPRIVKLLLETGGYTDLDKPVILTSGELGIYYINTEKLCQDGEEFKKYGDNSEAMIRHAIKMTKEHPTFNEVIEIVTEKVKGLLPQEVDELAISGGQRRDWLFSGPVAAKLKFPHISLFKDGRMDIIYDCETVDNMSRFGPVSPRDYSKLGLQGGVYAVHVADLMTKGSSSYDPRSDPPTGWIPMLRDSGVEIKDLVNVVTRLQGGEEILEKAGVKVHSFVAIDEDFLRENSKNPERDIAYIRNPRRWSNKYLIENGALAFIDTFDPEGGKLDRAAKFLRVYEGVLKESGAWPELEEAVQEKYNKSLTEIVGGN